MRFKRSATSKIPSFIIKAVNSSSISLTSRRENNYHNRYDNLSSNLNDFLADWFSTATSSIKWDVVC